MQVPIIFTGPTSKSRSKFLSNQLTQNFYTELTPEGFVLQSFPGLTLFGAAETGSDRGMFEHQGILYKVTGTNLYSIDSFGNHTLLGSSGDVPGSGRCIFDGLSEDIGFASNGVLWHYDKSAGTVQEVTDVDLEAPNSLTTINNQIVVDGDGSRFQSSDIGDMTSFPSAYASAESNADDLIRPYEFQQQVWMFGDKTIEPWWNSGVGSPPFDRVEGGIQPKGLGAIHSIAENDQYVYFLGDDRKVYRLAYGQTQAVSNISIANEIEAYSTVSDAEGICFTFQHQNFYCLTFPTHNKTFCFNENVPIDQGWFNLSSNDGRWIGSSYAYAYGKHLVSDYRNSNVYELDINAYTENGGAIKRVRESGSLHGGLLGAPGKEIYQNNLVLIVETGAGNSSNDEPIIMLELSDDGGRTWATQMQASIGKAGDYIWEVRFDDLGSFYRRSFRISTSDPVYYCIHSAVGDFEVGI